MCEIQRQAPAHPNDQRLVTLMSNLRGVKHNCSSIGWKTRSPRRRSRLALPTRCHLNEQSVGCGTKLLKVLAGRSPRRRSRLALSSPCHRDEQLRGCEKQLLTFWSGSFDKRGVGRSRRYCNTGSTRGKGGASP